MERTDNLNIIRFDPLISPAELKKAFPLTDKIARQVNQTRIAIQQILTNRDKRRLLIVGPCSLYGKDSTFEYARRLADIQTKVADKLLLVMRAYIEKPRTTIGWKGLLYDPHLDGSYEIEKGFKICREIMVGISDMGMPVATEILDPITPQYFSDLVSWASIGARTTESQIHRQMASGLSMPIGFKNATDGNLTVAIDAVKSARSSHSFMGIDSAGKVIIAQTRGNPFGHLVMRGGSTGPNYSSEYVAFAEILLHKAQIENGIIIDCSHANSGKNPQRQIAVCEDVIRQIKDGSKIIAGIMLESFLEEGSQNIDKPQNLRYGVSLTDPCIGWKDTERLILQLAAAVNTARN